MSTANPIQALQGMRILLMEDQPIHQAVACALLQAQGAVVQVAANGQEGVRTLQQGGTPAFDVVLMEMQMPVMDGLSATRAIRAMPGLQALPIIALTASTQDAERDACLHAGMNAHMGKPFELQQLVHMLRRQVGWSDVLLPADEAAAISKPLH